MSRGSEKSREVHDKKPGRHGKAAKGERPEIGSALRTVYQHAIEEDIPPEMLDLLGKLS